jgi:hypothetical protein
MVVIVSRQAYLICESINYIVINEADDNEDGFSLSSKRKKTPASTKRQREYIKLHKPYSIVIDFISTTKGQGGGSNRNGMGGGDSDNVRITVHGLDRTVALYTEIVEQIREQMPDVLYLDKLVDRFLTNKEKDKDEN